MGTSATVLTQGAPATTEIDAIRARLHGDKAQWKLDYANAATPWGQAAASGTIANALPYKLDATATLSQAKDVNFGAANANNLANDQDAKILALKGTYSLSKRTSVYGLFTHVSNDDGARLRIGRRGRQQQKGEPVGDVREAERGTRVGQHHDGGAVVRVDAVAGQEPETLPDMRPDEPATFFRDE